MILIRRLNYRNIRLHGIYSGEEVGVRLRDGLLRFEPFLGFADKLDAIRCNAVPVLLDIHAYYQSNEAACRISILKPEQWIQGAMTPVGVYAVLNDHNLVIVTR